MTTAELIVAGLIFFSPAHATETKPDGSVECLALNMYHEARGQGSAGLLGVSSVVLNRVKDKRFPTLYVKLLSKGLFLGGGGRKKEKLFLSGISANFLGGAMEEVTILKN